MAREKIILYPNDKGHVFANREGIWDHFQMRVDDEGELIIAVPGNAAIPFDREQARVMAEHLLHYARFGILHPDDSRNKQ